MSYNKIQELADKFAHKTIFADRDQEFAQQRLRMKEFYLFFYRHLRSLLGDMEGDIRALKELSFNSQMTKILIKTYSDLLRLIKTSNPEKPYIMGEKFVQYVLEKPGVSVIDNLDFLIKHHLESNKIQTQTGSFLRNPSVNTFDKLKSLAKQVRVFMAENPPVPIPGSDFPPPMRPDIIAPESHTPAEPLDFTNPAIPSAKIR